MYKRQPLIAQDIFNLTAILAKSPLWDELAPKDRPTNCADFLCDVFQNIKIFCDFLEGKAPGTLQAIKNFSILKSDDTSDLADSFFDLAPEESSPTESPKKKSA